MSIVERIGRGFFANFLTDQLVNKQSEQSCRQRLIDSSKHRQISAFGPKASVRNALSNLRFATHLPCIVRSRAFQIGLTKMMAL
jgi:hypothetical protein